MNTISSLLNFIGNTIGSAPSTLATTSKTIVGAINEIMGKLTNTSPSVTITATTGTYVGHNITKYGNVVQLYIQVKNSSAVTEGNNIFVGTLSAQRPAVNVTSAAYNGARIIIAGVETNGRITVRASKGNATANETYYIGFTYITS